MPIKLQGKEYVTHSELVEWATKAGLTEVRTEILHIDIDKKQALIQATATGERGTFQGIGDALPDNVGRMIAVHWIRMAETRAVNRALRLYTGRSTTSIDELADTTPAAPAPAKKAARAPAKKAAPAPAKKAAPAPAAPAPSDEQQQKQQRSKWWAEQDGGAWFCAQLPDLGIKYGELASWTTVKFGSRPSTWPADHCRNLIRDLQQAESKALQDLKQWLEQANSSR